MLSVSDNGCGMDKNIMEKIFQPFFTTKETGRGTGLGLATVYGIVKQNNGLIEVDSEPESGTAFRIYLPRDKREPKARQQKEAIKSATQGKDTILVVEDEPAILAMTKTVLERYGYAVIPASTPEAALVLAEENCTCIHLLMTDVIMPDINGRDLAEKISKLCPDIKTIFMSGYTSSVIEHHGVLNQGVNFIQKPFAIEELINIVRTVLNTAD